MTLIHERIKASADRLNALCNQADSCIRAVEEFLVEECKIGDVRIDVPVTFSHGDGSLIFMKFNNKRFRLCVSFKSILLPWNEASRSDKLDVMERLPAFLEEAARRVEEEVRNIEERTIMTATSVLSAIDYARQKK